MREYEAKTVLIIDYYFPPVGGPGVHRTLGYVRHLAAQGWRPAVLTVDEGEHQFRDPSLLRRIPHGVPVHRTRSVEPFRLARKIVGTRTGGDTPRAGRAAGSGRRGLAKLARFAPWVLFPDRHVGWYPFATRRALELCRRDPVDVVYSTSTAVTSHLVACTVKTLLGTAWVADFQDPWTEEYASEFPTRPHRAAARALERLIVHRADQVTVTTEPMKDALVRRYPDSRQDRYHVIPMAYDPDAFAGVTPIRQPRFTVTHFGNFYGPRSPEPFLTALGECLRQDPALADSMEVRFFGFFEPRLRVRAEGLIAKYRLDAVLRLLDPVPYAEGIQHLVNSDLLLLVSDPGGCGQCLVPSKLFEYFAAGRPVLALAPPGAIARLMHQARAGQVVPPDDVGAIRKALLALHRRWREGTLAYLPHAAFIAGCTWPARTAQFAAVLDAALGRSRALRPLAAAERTL